MITTINAALVREAADEVGTLTLTNTYSGRGMWGERCFGFTADYHSEASHFYIALCKRDVALSEMLVHREHTDAMGLGTIYYFPGIQLDSPTQEDNS